MREWKCILFVAVAVVDEGSGRIDIANECVTIESMTIAEALFLWLSLLLPQSRKDNSVCWCQYIQHQAQAASG